MSKYTGIQKEHQLKNLVFDDYFDSKKFSWEQEVDNIDFIITNPKTRGDLFAEEGSGASVHYLWAEAKKDTQDVFEMLTQLLITCKKTYDKGEHLAPPYIGCFDTACIAFVGFHVILPIFTTNDFNWNTTPSNHEAPDFQKAMKQIKDLIGTNIVTYHFGSDDQEIKEFIKTHIGADGISGIKSPITKDNFQQIFVKWLGEVRPKIDVINEEWRAYKKNGILECDFYLADMMSLNGNSISKIENLKIVLENHHYKFKSENEYGRLSFSNIGFIDEGTAYTMFWARYERPPAEVYQKYIIERRDLLVPQNIREMKGSYFTPAQWVQKSQEYLTAVFGENWQDEYYIWDCAAGTGNLLVGLKNKYNVWASTIDNSDIERINALIDIDEALKLLPAHIFQFDFLNDSFDKLPEGLRNIIADPEKQKKLIVYINPPYAEAGSTAAVMGQGHIKDGVAVTYKTRDKYQPLIGAATNEISAQFMARIYHEIPACKLALFSKLKFVCTQNFVKFRKFFNADYKAGFVVHADTFDNVSGKFPIGFTVWNLDGKRFPKFIEVDVIEEGRKKKFWDDFNKSINMWIRCFDNSEKPARCLLICETSDFQHIHQPYLTIDTSVRASRQFICTEENIIQACIYFSMRLCIEPTWLNDRDQFYYPNDGWKIDTEFQNDCLVFTLFHGQNRISTNDGSADCVNHWIPFTEEQVDAKENFESNFMSSFLKGRTLSVEAQSVLGAGLTLWQYYHKKIKNIKTASVNASFYDIRAFFQGRNENGKMNNKSTDDAYTQLLGTLRDALKALTQKIQPKVYEYGFLKE